MTPPGPEWARRYEALRAHVTGEAPRAFVPVGLAVLWHRGVAAWMTSERSATDAGGAPEPAAPESGFVAGDDLTAPRSELVRLLAGTALLVVRARAS